MIRWATSLQTTGADETIADNFIERSEWRRESTPTHNTHKTDAPLKPFCPSVPKRHLEKSCERGRKRCAVFLPYYAVFWFCVFIKAKRTHFFSTLFSSDRPSNTEPRRLMPGEIPNTAKCEAKTKNRFERSSLHYITTIKVTQGKDYIVIQDGCQCVLTDRHIAHKGTEPKCKSTECFS